MALYDNILIRQEIINALPSEVGYSEDKIFELNNFMRRLIEENKIQCGSFLISRYGKIIACNSMGSLTYKENSTDFMPDSIRRIASITKLFTSIAIMQLIEQGKIFLYQTVSSIIDEFMNNLHGDITIFHLLTHTSGLASDGGYFSEPYPKGWWSDSSSGSWIKKMLSGPLQSKPGEAFGYCSSGFAILGEIISRVSGMSYEDYIHENVLEPLGIQNSFFIIPDELKHRVCLTSQWDEQRLMSQVPNAYMPPRSSGGLYSNLEDLWRLGQMFLNKGTFNGNRILSRKAVEAMTRNHLNNIPAYYWGANYKSIKMGLGVSLASCADTITTPETFGHEGAGRSAIYIDPVEELVAVYFVPSEVEWAPESILSPRNIIWSGLE
jgi:CubicO group peptidase (beta-lactamase class C family)